MNWIGITNIFVTICGYPLSYIEFVGTLTGLLSVWFAVKSNIWTWPIGLVNVSCFFVIFFQINLYSDMFLQVYFFVMSIYGWVVWNQKNEAKAIIETINDKDRIIISLSIIFLTIIIGYVVKSLNVIMPSIFVKPFAYPFVDTFVAILSIVATVLLAKKKIENWVLWILIDVISTVLYAKKNVLFIATEYIIFLCLASVGLITWLRLLKNEKRISIG